ncbi:MAG: MgtC/SapB family protein [Opitutaceae bacterium]
MEISGTIHELVQYVILLGIAYALALPLGLNREMKANGAGLRTFPIVAMAACAFLLVGRAVLPEGDAQARIMYGLMTGIGFIGGGAIIKGNGKVSGTATASSIWATGAIGMAVAYQQYAIAIVLSGATFLTLHFGMSAKRELNGEPEEEA